MIKNLEKFLFDAVKITKNADNGKCKYSGYGIGFHGKEALSHQSGGFGNLATYLLMVQKLIKILKL